MSFLRKEISLKKRGLELSVSFFVILILTIIIFAGSLYFLRQFYTATETLRQELDRDTEAQLQALIRDGSIVAVPLNKATLARGKGATFWVGVQNILNQQKNFGIDVSLSNAYTPEEEIIQEADRQFITQNWVLVTLGPHVIKNNEFKAIPARIVVGSTIAPSVPTPPGTYSFNVCVWDMSEYGNTPPGLCGDYAPNQPWYTGKVYKIFVEVP